MSACDSVAPKPRSTPILKRIAYGTLDERSLRVATTSLEVESDLKRLLERLMNNALQIVTRPEGLRAAVAVLTGEEEANTAVEAAVSKFCNTIQIRLYIDPKLEANPWLMAFGVRVETPGGMVKKPPLYNHVFLSSWYSKRIGTLYESVCSIPNENNAIKFRSMAVLMSFGLAHELIHIARHQVRYELGTTSLSVPKTTPSKWAQPRYGLTGFDGGFEFERRMEGGFLEGAWRRITDNEWGPILRQAQDRFSQALSIRSDDVTAQETKDGMQSDDDSDSLESLGSRDDIAENGPFDILHVNIPIDSGDGGYLNRRFRVKDAWITQAWEGFVDGTFDQVPLPPAHEQIESDAETYFSIVPRHTPNHKYGWHGKSKR